MFPKGTLAKVLIVHECVVRDMGTRLRNEIKGWVTDTGLNRVINHGEIY